MTSSAEAKTYLVRANAVAATLALGVRLAAAPETCGLHVVPLHDPNSTPQLSPIGISADGRFLAFASYAPLLRSDTNRRSDIYVFDISRSQLTIESALPDGSPANADSFGPDISDDGRFLTFHSSGQLIAGSGEIRRSRSSCVIASLVPQSFSARMMLENAATTIARAQ